MIVYVALGAFVLVADLAAYGITKLRERRTLARRAPIPQQPSFRMPSV